MKVITKVVIDIRSGKQIELECYDYDGPVAECKGGGGTTTTTTTGEIDYAYNDRMATIAEQQQDIANEYAEFWRTEYKPLESAQIAANLELMPQTVEAERQRLGAAGAVSELEEAQAQAQRGLIPKATAAQAQELELQREQAIGERSLVGARVGLERQQLETGRQEAMAARPVIGEFYKQALQGVDPTQRVSRARGDVARGFKGAEAAERRALGRIGLGGRARTEGAIRQRFQEQARATAFASTQAREEAEQESFQRLGSAVQQFRGGV